MVAVSTQEVSPGLVVYIDTNELRRLGGSETNADVYQGHDRAVVGPHQFLVVSVDQATQTCLAVPLFSNHAPGSRPLARAKMAGAYPEWANGYYHYSQWQHWRIPLSAFAAASTGELSAITDRCRYAANDPRELGFIASWAARNRAPFRAP